MKRKVEESKQPGLTPEFIENCTTDGYVEESHQIMVQADQANARGPVVHTWVIIFLMEQV